MLNVHALLRYCHCPCAVSYLRLLTCKGPQYYVGSFQDTKFEGTKAMSGWCQEMQQIKTPISAHVSADEAPSFQIQDEQMI